MEDIFIIAGEIGKKSLKVEQILTLVTGRIFKLNVIYVTSAL